MLDEELTHSRRQYPRISSENVVMIHRIGPVEQAEMATARQIGLGGLMISSVESLGVDSYLRLTITIDNEVVEATGRVVWERPADGAFDVGVAFVSIDSAHSDTILAQMARVEAI